MTSDFRTDGLITQEQACTNFRRILDAARERRDRDRARDVLPPQVEFMLRRLEHKQHTQPAPHATDADVVLLHLAGHWSSPAAPYTSLVRLAEATGLVLAALRDALTHLTAASEVQLSRGNSPAPVNPMDVPKTAGFEVLADWHLINHRRPGPQAQSSAG
ncbi:hypothetical protein [Streptomyces sp. G-G2]|uniref:hypothetical protein n=1 Tax=Streptomyces sp. G-G2 TaxID=3046201 RepID=UPI0024BA16E0|nr:hypothetical protein [Streptomyces sp. G-G2]MDJ0385018.1 hypothetical protein [Streptomyces sp. G-G2]